MYYADGLTYGECDPDDDEFLDLVKIPFERAVEMVVSGEIKDAKTQAAILKVAYLKANNKI
jgi:ADP-ribose pyrophosphatase